MIDFLKNDINEINEIVRLTADKRKLIPMIVEKDLWVCYILDYLFNRCQYKDYFEFKGGTSLSKAYGLIERFSEDIDIVMNSSALGINLQDVINMDSSNQKTKAAEELNRRAIDFFNKDLIPLLESDLNNETGKYFRITLNKEDMAIYIEYPASYEATYILNRIKLEIGPLAAWTPFEEKPISCFIAEDYPNLFRDTSFKVRITKPVRTFWEKAIILHQEAHRDNGKVPRRYSRHYYDIYKMYDTGVRKDALNDIPLLDEVREFTKTFYNRNWARFDEAKPGTFKVVPNPSSLKNLKEDYRSMEIMIYGNVPSFEEIFITMEKLEEKINAIKI